MTATGDNTTITIAGTDYSTRIETVDVTGGDKEYKIFQTYNGNYKKILTGYTPYELELGFRVDDTTLHTLYQTTTPINIVIALLHDDGTTTTTTYSNMVPSSISYEYAADNIAMAKLKYTVEALAAGKIDNRTVS